MLKDASTISFPPLRGISGRQPNAGGAAPANAGMPPALGSGFAGLFNRNGGDGGNRMMGGGGGANDNRGGGFAAGLLYGIKDSLELNLSVFLYVYICFFIWEF